MLRESPLALLVSATVVLLVSLCAGEIEPKANTAENPSISDVRIVSLSLPADNQVAFELVIEGKNLRVDQNQPAVSLDTKDSGAPVSGISFVPLGGTEIRVKGTGKVGTEITRVVVAVDGEKAETAKGFTLALKANPPEDEFRQFEIKFEHHKNKQFPNLHSLVVTKDGGPSSAGFATNPHWMTVDLVPTGATDLNIVQSNAQQLDLHFVAAADYEPKSVVITVYDGSDLDNRKAKCRSIDKKPPAEDPDQPKITGTEIVFIEREQGMGRIRIYGKGFGDYVAPPYPLDDYVRNCAKRFWIEDPDPTKFKGNKLQDALDRQKSDFDHEQARLNACSDLLNGSPRDLGTDKVAQLRYTNPASFVTGAKNVWEDAEKVRKNVTVTVNPGNPDVRVEKVEILNINDKMIDVFFEFERYRGYALPFRLADATVTIKKMVQKNTQTVKNEKVTGTVNDLKPVTYSAPYQPGPKRDANLSYKYTVLDNKSANTLVGRGIADNFFVLQLSVVNNGDKKVAIPLSAIQAEVEWAASALEKREFRVGPVTLPPVPLAAVSGYFDAYQKVKGTRATIFNVLDAATIVATGLVPFSGPSFKDAALYFSGAAVPAARKGWGDLSGQQLQNLTALSWESSETLPAKGGSKEKLIYIPMRKEKVGEVEEEEGIKKEVWKQVTNITDVEVTGYEVLESEAKQATPSATGTMPGASAAPAAPSETAPATPASPGEATKTAKKEAGPAQ